jgi:V-type H+-transporting ATPase subunit a
MRTQTTLMPPTYFRTNDFTWAFQEIVNTYGIPTYKEVNPSVFACVTFPFLFGVMFGDIGHGFMVFAFGLYLCIKNEQLSSQKSALAVMLPARFLILLMGVFATYNGLIYNDFMAIPINAFWGSCYTNEHGEPTDVRNPPDCVYPIGIDWVWNIS